MNKLYIPPDKDSPEVCIDPEAGIFSITGISHPENISVFFEPVIQWFDQFKEEVSQNPDAVNYPKTMQLKCFFIYINSSTYKYLITIILKACELMDLGIMLEITWYYEPEDYDMRDAGVELMQYIDIKHLPFRTEVKERLK